MAYVAFDEIGALPVPAAAPALVRSEQESQLSPLEWSVVALSRRDPLSSLREPGRAALALRSLFRHTNLKLADERLEALRRLAVLTWHHSFTVPAREIEAFLAAGFTKAQYEAVAASIATARLSDRGRKA